MAEINRRTLLTGAVLGAGAVAGVGLGLTRGVHHKVAVPPPPPPPALTAALAAQQSLLAGYDAVPDAPAGLKSDVTEHGQALRALLELYPGWRLARQGPRSAGLGTAAASPTVTDPTAPATPTDRAGLRQASTALAGQLGDAALDWAGSDPNGAQVVPVLASVAACLTTHAEVLA